jgi:DNA-directed RNA polymerase III subunit RPC3
MRNQQLTRLAHKYAGDTTAKLFEALIHSLDGHIHRCYDPYEHPSALLSNREPDVYPRISSTIPTIIEHLDPPDIDLNQGLPGGAVSNGINGHHKPTDVQLKRKYTDEIRAARAKKHLDLLVRIKPKFVNPQSSTTWNIPYKSLTRELIQEEIENTVTARLGPVASRIIRILHQRFSSDEKFLAHEAILKTKEVRATTNALIASGLVSTHEIPRDVNRTTNRLLWLYAYDSSKARKTLITDSYRTMLRLLKRIESERKSIQTLIDKSEREDVVGKEKELLSADELKHLDRFAVVEKGILAHIARVDDLVACLRDFSPIDDPFIGNRRRAGDDEPVDELILDEDD